MSSKYKVSITIRKGMDSKLNAIKLMRYITRLSIKMCMYLVRGMVKRAEVFGYDQTYFEFASLEDTLNAIERVGSYSVEGMEVEWDFDEKVTQRLLTLLE